MDSDNIFDPDDIPTWLASLWPQKDLPKYVIAGINEDDCAVLETESKQIVITTDFLNATPIAKQLGICTNWDLGRLVVAANLSDLCGTGAKPIAMLLAIVMERNASTSDFKALIEGAKFELDKYSIPLVGGDTKLGKSMALLGVALGIVPPKGKLFLKRGAQKGDLIWVSGNIGATSASVDGLTNFEMEDDWKEWAKESLISPNLPIEKSADLALSKLANGGTDLSDGLGADLFDLCSTSNVGAIIEVSKIPIDKPILLLAQKRNIPAWSYAFIIGGDFQFIATTPTSHFEEMQKMGFVNIGRITLGKEMTIQLESGDMKTMPLFGHRDSRKMSFSEEVNFFLEKIAKENYDKA